MQSQTSQKPKSIHLILSYFPYLCISLLSMYTACYLAIPQSSSTYNSLALNTSAIKNQIYQIYTYSLLHANSQHIIINNLSILVYCILLESGDAIDILVLIAQPTALSIKAVISRTMRLTGIHTLSVIGGAFGVVWESFAIDKPIKVVGASAGAYGLLAVHASNLVLNWHETTIIRRTFSILLLSAILLADIIVTSISPNEDTAYSSHISGALTGILSGILFLHNIKYLRWEKIIRVICGIILLMYFTATFIYIER